MYTNELLYGYLKPYLKERENCAEERKASHDTKLRDQFIIGQRESQSKGFKPSSAFLGALNAQTSFVTSFPVFAPSNSDIHVFGTSSNLVSTTVSFSSPTLIFPSFVAVTISFTACGPFPSAQKSLAITPLDLNASRENLKPILQNGLLLTSIIIGDSPTSSDPASLLHPRQHQIENLASDVVEIDLHIAISRLDQILLEAELLVIQTHVSSQTLDPFGLVITPRFTNYLLAPQHLLRNLRDHTPRSPCSSTDDNSILPPGPRYDFRSVVSRQAGQTESAQVMRDAKTGDVLTGLAFHGSLHRVFRPACCSQHLVALAVIGRFGLDDLGSTTWAIDRARMTPPYGTGGT